MCFHRSWSRPWYYISNSEILYLKLLYNHFIPLHLIVSFSKSIKFFNGVVGFRNNLIERYCDDKTGVNRSGFDRKQKKMSKANSLCLGNNGALVPSRLRVCFHLSRGFFFVFFFLFCFVFRNAHPALWGCLSFSRSLQVVSWSFTPRARLDWILLLWRQRLERERCVADKCDVLGTW